MSSRSRRKRTFKSNEESVGIKMDETEEHSSCSTPDITVGKQDEESTYLNVRRSSRRPKPKRRDHEEDDDVLTGQTTAEKTTCGKESGGNSSTNLIPECPQLDTSKPLVGVRRETRKTYQSYLETLGYNTDFSKIPEKASPERPVKVKIASSIHKTTGSKQSKRDEKASTKHLVTEVETDKPEEKSVHITTKVRASSRTPKPKRTFALLQESGSATHLNVNEKSDKIAANSGDSPGIPPGTKSKTSNLVKIKTEPSHDQKPHRGKKQVVPPVEQTVTTTKPLSKHDIDNAELLSDEDQSQTRTSRRARVPKRKFSLIEDSSPAETKIQKVMSPDQTNDIQVDNTCEEKVKDKKDTNQESQSKLVIKRSDPKKQRSNRRRLSQLDAGKEEQHVQKESESEKKVGNKRGKQKDESEPIVQKLKIAKEPTVVKDNIKKSQNDKDEVKTEKSEKKRKFLKRKKEKSDVDKSGSELEEKEKKNDNETGHIVLKLTIPHESPKTEGKEKVHDKHHHKHHHHHKHKKEKKGRQNDVGKKKPEQKSEEDTERDKETSTEASENLEMGIQVKKKKRRRQNNDATSESLSSDSSTVPHVKLVIKKSPVKAKDVKVTLKQDSSKVTSKSLPSKSLNKESHASDKPQLSVTNETSTRKDKAELPATDKTPITKKDKAEIRSKTKSLTKKDKPPSKSPKKTLKKDEKVKTVSAYSLFTKSRRKNLLELEPDLDFASTSRRLAEMWKELSADDKEYWRAKAIAIRKPSKESSLSRKSRHDLLNAWTSKDSDMVHSSGTDAVDMAAYLKLLGESLCSIGMCLKRQDQMEVHGSLSVLLDTALCSVVPLFCLTSQLPEMAGCPPEIQAQILDNLAYIIPGL